MPSRCLQACAKHAERMLTSMHQACGLHCYITGHNRTEHIPHVCVLGFLCVAQVTA